MKIHQILINDTNKLPDEFPEFHDVCVQQIKKIYSNEEYHLYSGEEIEDIIKFNFHANVYKSYKKLKPYACKADLAKYCLLYLYGGLYIDLNIYFINSIPYLDKLEFFAFRDESKMSQQCWAVQTGIMYSTPKSKIVKNAIEIILKNCRDEYYGIQCVDVSATTVLGTSIITSLPNFRVSTKGELDFFDVKFLSKKIQNTLKKIGYSSDILMGFIMDDDDKVIAIRKPCNPGDIISLGFHGTNNYVEMWRDRDVYDRSIKFYEKSIFNYE